MLQNTLSKQSVTIVVPTRNNTDTIRRCLTSIRTQTYPHIELIVVDNHSTDDTYIIAKEFADTVLLQGPERSTQRNAGLAIAQGHFILFIDSDMYLAPQVVERCVQKVHATGVNCVFIPEKTIAKGFWGQCKKFERDFYTMGDMSVEAARFFMTQHLRDIGGYNEDKVALEDWDISDRYIARYKTYDRIESAITHDEGMIVFADLLKKKQYYGRTGVRNGLSNVPVYRRAVYPLRPSVIRQWYRFLQSPIYGTGSIVMKICETIAAFT